MIQLYAVNARWWSVDTAVGAYGITRFRVVICSRLLIGTWSTFCGSPPNLILELIEHVNLVDSHLWAGAAYACLLLVSFQHACHIPSHDRPVDNLEAFCPEIFRIFALSLDLSTVFFFFFSLNIRVSLSPPTKAKVLIALEITCSTSVDIGYYGFDFYTTSPSLINWMLGEGLEGMCTQVVSGYPNWCSYSPSGCPFVGVPVV